jgi:hypothetical protein
MPYVVPRGSLPSGGFGGGGVASAGISELIQLVQEYTSLLRCLLSHHFAVACCLSVAGGGLLAQLFALKNSKGCGLLRLLAEDLALLGCLFGRCASGFRCCLLHLQQWEPLGFSDGCGGIRGVSLPCFEGVQHAGQELALFAAGSPLWHLWRRPWLFADVGDGGRVDGERSAACIGDRPRSLWSLLK